MCTPNGQKTSFFCCFLLSKGNEPHKIRRRKPTEHLSARGDDCASSAPGDECDSSAPGDECASRAPGDECVSSAPGDECEFVSSVSSVSSASSASSA